MAKGCFGMMLMSLLIAAQLQAQETSTEQTLTLQVLEINKIGINKNAITLVIDQASLETGLPLPAENEDGMLVWITNGENKKITVASNNPTPRFLVKMAALEVSSQAGTPAPEVILSDNTTKDLIVGISKTSGKCKIKLTASAQISDGVGTETHVITYTITGS
jgi:hypothetical protein